MRVQGNSGLAVGDSGVGGIRGAVVGNPAQQLALYTSHYLLEVHLGPVGVASPSADRSRGGSRSSTSSRSFLTGGGCGDVPTGSC